MCLKQLVERETDGQLRLAKHVIAAAGDKPRNLVLSPLSIHVVLAMIAAGSRGSTRAQLLTYLNSESVEQLTSFFPQIAAATFADCSPLGGPLLLTENKVSVDGSLTLKPAFRDVVENSYKAVLQDADFRNKAEEARKEANEWAEKKTKGLIKESLPQDSVTHLTRLIFANAVYFKGKWDQEFDATRTKNRDFHLLNGSRIRARLMTSRKRQYVAAYDGFKVAKLPYKRGSDKRRFSMYIYLPDDRDGLQSLAERMCSEPGFIDHHLPRQAEILENFLIPKFRIEFELEASRVLKEMGVVDAFEAGGLTEMVEEGEEGKALFVDRVSQKAFVEVDEKGTVAAAVTMARVGGCRQSEKRRRLEFVADHPFLFIIREDTDGVLLFVGQLLDPRA